MSEELFKGSFAVQSHKTANIEWVPDPIDGRRLAQHRTLAAVQHAPDDLVPRVVIRFVQVKTGEAARPLLIFCICRHREAHAIEELQTFAQMHPVRLDAKI